MLELVKVYNTKLILYKSGDNRFRYYVEIKHEPCSPIKQVIVTIQDCEYDNNDKTHQNQSTMSYICKKFSESSMLRQVQKLFDRNGLIINKIFNCVVQKKDNSSSQK